MTSLPVEPTGSHPLENAVKQLIKCVRERTILPSDFIAIEQTPSGILLKAKRGAGSGGSRREIELCVDGESGFFAMVDMGPIYRKDEEEP